MIILKVPGEIVPKQSFKSRILVKKEDAIKLDKSLRQLLLDIRKKYVDDNNKTEHDDKWRELLAILNKFENGTTYVDKKKIRTQAYQKTKVTDYADKVARYAKEQYSGPLLEGPLFMLILVYLKRPENHFKKDRSLSKAGLTAGIRWCMKNKDVDNISKNIMDPLHGIIYENDKTVCYSTVKKYWADEGKERVEIRISKLED